MRNKVTLVLVAVLIFAAMLMVTGCGQTEEEKAATDVFNKEVSRIEAQLEQRDKDVARAEEVYAIEKPALDEKLKPALQTEITEAKALEFEAPKAPRKLEEITAATEELKKIDFTKDLEELNKARDDLDVSIKKCELVTAPKESYVVNCLKGIKNIDGVAAVTEDHDPNGNLNKEGGYTAQVYFSSPLVDDPYLDSDIIEAGTDGGGSVEVYKTPEEAKKREEYLATFDGGVLASGSHAVVGTCLVRTSNNLTASQQKDMEKAIIDALTNLENSEKKESKGEKTTESSDN